MRKIKGYLLDTHALLWMLYGDPRLSETAAKAINSDLSVYASIASFWEIAIKQSNKSFDFQIESNWHTLFQNELKRIDVKLLSLSVADCRKIQDLSPHHQDPFDRILIAQAMNQQLSIISKDKTFSHYKIPIKW